MQYKAFKKGETVKVKDVDGEGYTLAKTIEASAEDDYYVRVKWLEPRWHLSQNLLMNRKNSKSLVGKDSIK